MYGTNIANTLSLSKVLGGLSRTLGIVNQAIPIYKEIKPMVGNAKKIIGIVREFSKTNNNGIKAINKTSSKIVDANAKEKIDSINHQSFPVFFQ